MILAVDPGIATCGWAIVRPGTGRVHALGVLVSAPEQHLDQWTDRSRRAAQQASFLGDLAKRHACTTIAAEGISVGGGGPARFSMGTSLCLSWGVLAGIAHCLSLTLFEVPPKLWQHAVTPGLTKVDYAVIYKTLSAFVEKQANTSLMAIRERLRNHAIDAVGVGVYAALKTANRISQQPRPLA